MQVRHRNIETGKDKDRVRAHKEAEECAKQEKNYQTRVNQREAIKYNIMSQQEKNFKDAERLKQERMQHEEMIAMQRKADELKAVTMKQMIRS